MKVKVVSFRHQKVCSDVYLYIIPADSQPEASKLHYRLTLHVPSHTVNYSSFVRWKGKGGCTCVVMLLLELIFFLLNHFVRGLY